MSLEQREELESNVSVVIRTRNEERWVGHTIQSVLDQIIRPEIIVVDSHSTDETIHIVQHFQQDPELNNKKSSSYTKLKIIPIDHYTPGKSINLGVQNSSNDYILVISSHCVLKNLNLEKHKQDLEKHHCVFGNQVPVWNGKKITKRYIWSHFHDEEQVNMYSEQEGRYFIHNGLAFYKKATLVETPFDEFLVGKEDRYWANDVINSGFKILYDPEMKAEHHYTINGNTWKGIG
jgi:rhamnosyltransferase